MPGQFQLSLAELEKEIGEAVKLEKLLSDAFGSEIAEKILWKNANDFFTEKVLK